MNDPQPSDIEFDLSDVGEQIRSMARQLSIREQTQIDTLKSLITEAFLADYGGPKKQKENGEFELDEDVPKILENSGLALEFANCLTLSLSNDTRLKDVWLVAGAALLDKQVCELWRIWFSASAVGKKPEKEEATTEEVATRSAIQFCELVAGGANPKLAAESAAWVHFCHRFPLNELVPSLVNAEQGDKQDRACWSSAEAQFRRELFQLVGSMYDSAEQKGIPNRPELFYQFHDLVNEVNGLLQQGTEAFQDGLAVKACQLGALHSRLQFPSTIKTDPEVEKFFAESRSTHQAEFLRCLVPVE